MRIFYQRCWLDDAVALDSPRQPYVVAALLYSHYVNWLLSVLATATRPSGFCQVIFVL